jgi:GxxExxY protein
MTDIIYKNLSFQLNGLAFEVCNGLGYGLKETVYKDAYEQLLKEEKIPYQREFYYPIKVRDKIITKRYFDFFIDEKIIIEFKIGGNKYFDGYNQLLEYLKSSGVKLGIIVRFTSDGVKIKRIPNIY